MNQPYQAPGANVAVASDESYQPKFLSLSGRIGRMRYFGYASGLTFLFYLAIAIVGIVAAVLIPSLASAGAGGVETAPVMLIGLLAIVGFIAVLVMSWGYMVRRLNDFNASGWLSLLMLVPLVNLILGLVLIFKKGSQGENDYGAAPVANSGAVKALFAVLVFLMIGYFTVLLPMSLVQYGDYMQRAEQASQMQFEDY